MDDHISPTKSMAVSEVDSECDSETRVISNEYKRLITLKAYKEKVNSLPGSIIRGKNSVVSDESDAYDIKYIWRKAQNDTIKEEDSNLMNTTLFENNLHNIRNEEK